MLRFVRYQNRHQRLAMRSRSDICSMMISSLFIVTEDLVDELFDRFAVALGYGYAERKDAHEHHSSKECSHRRLSVDGLDIDSLYKAVRVGLQESFQGIAQGYVLGGCERRIAESHALGLGFGAYAYAIRGGAVTILRRATFNGVWHRVEFG